MNPFKASYDFIIVGAGPAGCTVASRLADALPNKTILLVDAGGMNDDPSLQNFGDRFWTLGEPGYNWGYRNTPQVNLAGREITYDRGKGLGGSTAVNFCVWTRGPQADFDRWAEMVEDETWDWHHVLERYRKPPANLTIMTEAAVDRLLFEGQKCIGVEISGKEALAQEVILSAGAIDSPKLLLLSGVGPQEDLAKHGIPLVHDLLGIGRNLRDHLWLELVTTQKPGAHHRTSHITSPDELQEARRQWLKDKASPLSVNLQPQMIAYLKNNNILHSEEYEDLDKSVRESYENKTTPHYELITHLPSPIFKGPDNYIATGVAPMGTLSSGQVKLRSSNPQDPPLIDPKFLSHPFDRRNAIEAVRETLNLLDLPDLRKDRMCFAEGPDGQTDEALLVSKGLTFVQKAGLSMWHMCGTVQMGKPSAPSTCVDTSFHVIGTHGLRVVDMSIAPFMPNAHTQAVAYLIGETAAEKIIKEYTGQ
ncbi:uncharacterized protein KY384_008534 [Bacidia gigantensis]|uniref:uncharacterized protein n=1 Tax=Bacidia gigantensis TaxID=2732470 RepID=UPI001D0448E0|nr:uncharacterized protein KY384_008534 [Bacidia gigantensis]KAG8527105.1 hypothetical protein KY384_008534 [Bacidia gigantensis]